MTIANTRGVLPFQRRGMAHAPRNGEQGGHGNPVESHPGFLTGLLDRWLSAGKAETRGERVNDPVVPTPEPTPTPGHSVIFDRKLISLKRRLVREASEVISMLERALDALWRLDRQAAAEVRRIDDTIDREEVQIEQECFSLLTLHHVFARDFRVVTFVLKVNHDIERVGDHASSIAKIVGKIQGDLPPTWPTALLELGQRVPVRCHELLRAVLDEDVDAARALVAKDKTIDGLDARLFGETVEFMQKDGSNESMSNGLLIHRAGRELERVGDLMSNIAEEVVYLATGDIIRHTHKKGRKGDGSPASSAEPIPGSQG